MKISRLYTEYFQDNEGKPKERYGITIQGKHFLQNTEISKSDFNDLVHVSGKENGLSKGERTQPNEFLTRITFDVL